MIVVIGVDKLFSLNHFIWLGISAIIIISFTLITIKKKIELKYVLNFMIVACALSQLSVILYHIELGTSFSGTPGYFLSVGSFPFHLCSLQLYLMIFLKYSKKDTRAKQMVINFMYTTALVGAFMALLIPTAGTDFVRDTFIGTTRCYEYFLYHSLLVAYSIYTYVRGYVKLSLKSFKETFIILLIAAYISLYINGALKTNFLYTSYPPMDNLPILSAENGWLAYIMTLIAVSILCLTITYIPAIIRFFKLRKSQKKNNLRNVVDVKNDSSNLVV